MAKTANSNEDMITLSMDQLSQMVEQALAKKEAEKAEEVRKATEAEAEEERRQREWLEEKVPFTAFRDGREYKDDIFAAIGQYRYQIKRGKTVMIPRRVRMLLEQSNYQLNVSSDYAEQQMLND